MDIENTQEEFYHEYLYSRFLEMILPIFDNLVVEKTKWRILESFLTNMGESM